VRQKFDRYFYQLKPYPSPTETPWFERWEQEQRELGFVAYDTEPEKVFELAFTQKEDPTVRWLMTGTIGLLGKYDMLDKVYEALEDREDMVRDRAYRTLADFQEQ